MRSSQMHSHKAIIFQKVIERDSPLHPLQWARRVYAKSCERMAEIPDGMIDLVVTSPPYDSVRTYSGNASFDIDAVARELYRVCYSGSVVCWVVQDQTIDGAKSDTSFEQVFRFKEAGFRRWETIIYQRHGRPGPWWNKRLRVDHEYIHVFIKGDAPLSYTKPLVAAKWPGHKWHGTDRLSSGETVRVTAPRVQSDTKCRGTIWDYGMSGSENNFEKSEHPATFPDGLASDCIRAFSSPCDIVLDPFMGSGTTAVMAEVLQRNWVGYEVNAAYHALIEKRLRQAPFDFTETV